VVAMNPIRTPGQEPEQANNEASKAPTGFEAVFNTLTLEARIDLTNFYVAEFIGPILESGEGNAYIHENGDIMYVLKHPDGRISLVSASTFPKEELSNYRPRTITSADKEIAEYRFVKSINALKETYVIEINGLTERFGARGAEVSFFHEFIKIAERYNLPFLFVRVPLKWHDGKTYNVTCCFFNVAGGVRPYIIPPEQVPSDLLAHLANFTLDDKYTDISSFGKELLNIRGSDSLS
ncbi:MAG: hypothetical protein AAB592_00420, partial [Patescibacteria group bacterium]